MKINLNRHCNVILTAHGAEVYNEYFRELHAICQQIELTHLKAEDEVSLQMWELMNIFGKHLYNGAENCFVNNDISFNDKVAKIPECSREKIKELLTNWKGTLVVGNEGIVSLSPWISVEERLPNINRNSYSDCVLTIDENQNVVVAFYSFYRGGWIRADGEEDIDDSIIQNDITHWMPIPELPKEE